MDKNFNLEYLPLFEQDLSEVRDYIAKMLQNPTAALKLINDTEKAIQKRLKNPLGYKPYNSSKNRMQPYYTIRVRNYTVFYVIVGNVMEVRRFVYSRRNLPDIV